MGELEELPDVDTVLLGVDVWVVVVVGVATVDLPFAPVVSNDAVVEGPPDLTKLPFG